MTILLTGADGFIGSYLFIVFVINQLRVFLLFMIL